MSSITNLISVGVNGTGTANSVMKWLDADTATDSIIYDNGTNVGIGTSSPLSKLQIDGSVILRGDNTQLVFRGTPNVEANMFTIIAANFATPNFEANRIAALNSSHIAIETGASERMRITSGGDVVVGATAPPISGRLFSVKADGKVAGSFYRVTTDPTDAVAEFVSNIGGTPAVKCVVYADGDLANSNNSYGALSDAKLKENVVDATPKLDDLLRVKVRNYNLIGDETKQLGVVAQELEEVFPSLVKESPDFEDIEVEVKDEEGNIVYKTEQVLVSEAVLDEEGNVIEEAVYETVTTDEPEMTTERVDLGTTTKSVKYSVFVPMLIKAMQEQQEIINDLKARIETLENK